MRCVCLLFPLRFPFGFVHSSFSVVARGFVLRRPARRERLAPRNRVERRAERIERKAGECAAAALLNQIARNKICILLRAIPGRGSDRRAAVENSRLPIATAVDDGGSNSAISPRDMGTTLSFDSPVSLIFRQITRGSRIRPGI